MNQGKSMPAEIWQQRDVAAAFLKERSLLIPDRARQLGVMLRILRSAPRSPRRILDLGAGDAVRLATVLEAFPEAIGVAVDFSHLMLEQARVRLAPFGRRAVTVETDLQTPAWQNGLRGPFDAIVSGFAIHHLSHERKRALYREIYELLSEGGVFLNAEHVASATPKIEEMFNDAMSEHLFERRREKGEDVTLEQVRREYVERPGRAANILATVEEQCHWLREIGFREVDCFWKYFELTLFGGIR
jgi:ubiquinone/menaquinone biosynthesis C-methylase UbiE